MSDAEQNAASGGTGEGQQGKVRRGRVPFMQKVLDNPFLLLFLGVVMPTVFYLIWGILEVAQIPIAD